MTVLVRVRVRVSEGCGIVERGLEVMAKVSV